MAQFDPNVLSKVPNFMVEHSGYGKVMWEGEIDLRGIDLDKVLIIEKGKAWEGIISGALCSMVRRSSWLSGL